MEGKKQTEDSHQEDQLSPEAKRRAREVFGLPEGNGSRLVASPHDDEQPSLAQSVSELATLVEFGRYAAFCAESESFDEVDWVALFDLMIKHAITARQLVLFGRVDSSDLARFE